MKYVYTTHYHFNRLEVDYDRGRSFLPVYSAHRETLATFTTLNLTPAVEGEGEVDMPTTAHHTYLECHQQHAPFSQTLLSTPHHSPPQS